MLLKVVLGSWLRRFLSPHSISNLLSISISVPLLSLPISTHRWYAASQVMGRGLRNHEPKQTCLPLSCLSHVLSQGHSSHNVVSTQRIFKANSSAPCEITRGWEVPAMPRSLRLCCESLTQVTDLLAFQLCIFTKVVSACLISYWWKGVDICNMAAFF